MERTLTIGLAVVLAAAGCNGRSEATAGPPDAAPVAVASAGVEGVDAGPGADASADAGPATPPVRRRGLVGAFFKAAQDADLSDDQKTTIAKLEEPLQSDTGPRREMTALHADLVASVKDGKIDAAKVAADEAAVAKMLSAREEEQAAALAGLHDALTPAQRGAVADAVRTARERPPPAVPPAGGTDWAARRLEHMKAQLVLDEDQQKQVAAVLAREAPTPATIQAHFEAVKKQTEATAAAFEKDTFDPKKVDLAAAPGKKATDPFDREVKYIGQLLPILTAGQRDRFAGLMEHPRERMGRGDSITEAPDPGGTGPGR
jgi:Spy/CpxP family protein refolding chaperone